LSKRVASVRSINIPVPELNKEIEKTSNALVEESLKAIEQDGAKSIILGCTGMKGFGEKISKKIERVRHRSTSSNGKVYRDADPL
jgi:Asp/Glu/hydantoin racemase